MYFIVESSTVEEIMEIYCRVDFDLGLQLCNYKTFHANCFVVVLSTFHHFWSVNPSLSTKVAVGRNPNCTLSNPYRAAQLAAFQLGMASLTSSDLRRRNSCEIDQDRNLLELETFFSAKLVISHDSLLLVNPNHEIYASE